MAVLNVAKVSLFAKTRKCLYPDRRLALLWFSSTVVVDRANEALLSVSIAVTVG
jgi:hypothetical protein